MKGSIDSNRRLLSTNFYVILTAQIEQGKTEGVEWRKISVSTAL